MLGDERDRHDKHGNPVMRGPLDLGLGARIEPFLRRRSRLIAHHPIDIRRAQRPHHRLDRALDLELIGIAAADDRLGQTMRREQHAQRRCPAATSPAPMHMRHRNRTADRTRHSRHQRNSSTAGGRHRQPGARRGLPPSGQRTAGRRGGILRIQRQQQNLRPDAMPAPRARPPSLNGCQ